MLLRTAPAAVALAVLLLVSSAGAQELAGGAGSSKPPSDRPQSPQREALTKRFEQRLERLNTLKDKGVIGETWEGSVEALDDHLLSKDERTLLDDENKDRKALYALIGDRTDDPDTRHKKAPPRVVAERNAKRKFESAKADHYLKIAEGRWIQKRDEDRADKIATLKKDGMVGEMSDGYLAPVKSKPGEDVKSVIERENRARREMYGNIAKRLDKGSAEDVARAAAHDVREHLPPGQYFKERDGDWQKKR